jgi:DNA-binding response OmpR family regulator
MAQENCYIKPTVLLTDDDQNLLGMLAAILSHAGFRVLPALDGNQALQASQHYPGEIDLLLSDIHMGLHMNGFELAVRLRRERPRIRILLMSGSFQEPDMPGEGLEFIRKPFRPEGLLHKIRSMLENSDAASPRKSKDGVPNGTS